MRRHYDDWALIEGIAGREPAAEESPLFDRPAWHADAHCGRNGIIGDDAPERTRLMFPERGHAERLPESRAVCDGCPSSDACLSEVIRMVDVDLRGGGIRGGLSGEEQRYVRKAMRLGATVGEARAYALERIADKRARKLAKKAAA